MYGASSYPALAAPPAASMNEPSVSPPSLSPLHRLPPPFSFKPEPFAAPGPLRIWVSRFVAPWSALRSTLQSTPWAREIQHIEVETSTTAAQAHLVLASVVETLPLDADKLNPASLLLLCSPTGEGLDTLAPAFSKSNQHFKAIGALAWDEQQLYPLNQVNLKGIALVVTFLRRYFIPAKTSSGSS